MSVRLHINIDHVATVRNARGEKYPDPVLAAQLCEAAGADGITAHLREDRRHIRDEDVFALKRVTKGLLNLEMACTEEMVRIALKLKPHQVTLVPEKREELTTEGGLDVRKRLEVIRSATRKLRKAGIAVSHFIEPDGDQVSAAAECGASHIEFHTGVYARHFDDERPKSLAELERLVAGSLQAHGEGLVVNAGHGLNYRNVTAIARLPFINELNIGHAIVGRALFSGFDTAVRDMIRLLNDAATIVEDSE